MGLLVTPQNTAPMPTAAHSGMEHPVTVAKKVPKVAPIKESRDDLTAFVTGAERGTSKSIFNRKASGKTGFPSMQLAIMLIPVRYRSDHPPTASVQ